MKPTDFSIHLTNFLTRYLAAQCPLRTERQVRKA